MKVLLLLPGMKGENVEESLLTLQKQIVDQRNYR